jgi:ElaB/YqjD/DUF883 family membrane-anchored ribosome-binding protein
MLCLDSKRSAENPQIANHLASRQKTKSLPMKNRNNSEPQTPADLLNDLRTLVIEAEKMLESSVSEHTGEALAALRTRYAAAQERFGDLYTSAKKNVTAGAKYTDETIRANPYQSIAIAAGVGLLVGVLVGRRNQ